MRSSRETLSREPAPREPASRERTQDRLRLRAAWHYYVEDMTQSDVAERLGVGRLKVQALLAEARRREEVKIQVTGDFVDLVALETQLEETLGLEEAILVPAPERRADLYHAIGAATGTYLSDQIRPGMTVGVGWGATLRASLSTLTPRAQSDSISVVTLQGSMTFAHGYNPSEFGWRVASLYGADCYLMAAPIYVDSAATRRTLIDRCGLGDVIGMAGTMDLCVLSVGQVSSMATTRQLGLISQQEQRELIQAGAVGDILCTFVDSQGDPVDHPVNERVMSVPLSILESRPRLVLASGGEEKVAPLIAAIRRTRPSTLITDEDTARDLLVRSSGA